MNRALLSVAQRSFTATNKTAAAITRRACASLASGGLENTSASVSSFQQVARFKSTATATYDQTVETFPSIVIGPDRAIEPQGSFAESQAQVRLLYNKSYHQ